MDILLVRHGESEANRAHRMQGRLDSPLSARGREQARVLARFLELKAIGWDAAYVSPLGRARETAAILCEGEGKIAPEVEPDLAEIDAGALQGLTRDEMAERHRDFIERPITELADFSAFGGEGYDTVQARIGRLVERWTERHRRTADRVLVVGHGGVNFQLVKALVCLPIPRVCIVRMENCAATLIHMRERRKTFIGELVWHLPIEMMGHIGATDTGAPFR
jgi:broad specificity phosphatase PhoE